MRLLYSPRSRNTKTDDVPHVFVGVTEEQTLASCRMAGCQLRTKDRAARKGCRKCYFWAGRSAVAKRSMDRAHARGKDYSRERALSGRLARTRMVRFGAGGDHVAAVPETVESARIFRKEGLDVIGFEHAWRQARAQLLRSILLASCDSLEETDEAITMGWKPATLLPQSTHGVLLRGQKYTGEPRFLTPAGHPGLVCPAQRNGRVTCNTCRRCDALKPGPVVGFIQHS